MFDWDQIATIFLDMDGTLLDLHFDNYFWLEYVPIKYSEQHGLGLDEAKQELFSRYKAIEGTLDWYCIDYWSEQLALDIRRLKHEVAHKISVHPYAEEFLQAARQAGKRLLLVTNAHGESVTLKLARTGLVKHFDRIIVSHDVGEPKENLRFWALVAQRESFEADKALLVDDNLQVLKAAAAYGIAYLLAVQRPDTRKGQIDAGEFLAIDHLGELLPIAGG